ncbi:hypothetical protein BSKO_05760 [Bryopsis sp. KO-2023]|nr:hypothetical protein BSKO_05760 [Bryopsis sp. KO-2023]
MSTILDSLNSSEFIALYISEGCSSKIKNCFKCTSGDKCDSCLPGFEGPQCTKIEGCDPNCTRCRNKELCDNNGCKTGYYTFRNGAGQCLSCSTQDIPDCERCFWFLAKNQRGPGELRCSNARGVICEQTRGVDYPGNDIINTPFNINNHPDCCAKCQGTKGCKGWLFRGDFGHCWLKSKLVNPEPCSDCIAMKI